MARDLTTPAPPVIEIEDSHSQWVTRVLLDVAVVDSGLGDGGALDLDKTALIYTVVDTAADGRQLTGAERVAFVPEWPPALRDNIRALLQMIYNDAETQGLLKPGTDGDDL